MFLLTNKTEKNDDVGIIKCNHRNIRPNSGTVNFVIELIIFILLSKTSNNLFFIFPINIIIFLFNIINLLFYNIKLFK